MKYLLFSIFLLSMGFFSCGEENEKATPLNEELVQQKKGDETIEDSVALNKEQPAEKKVVESAQAQKVSNKPKEEIVVNIDKADDSSLKSKEKDKVQVQKPIVEEKAKVGKVAVINFEQTSFDFGRIVQGEKVLHEFVFRNGGQAPLVIKDAKASCGCTQPIYPFIPIEPGEKGTILVQFNSKGRLGRQMPSINIFSNAVNSNVSIKMTGEVITEFFADTTVRN